MVSRNDAFQLKEEKLFHLLIDFIPAGFQMRTV